ncbi:hypothetical protein Ndes2526B_g03120 [Nannochloris sp. 'desiccata']
MNMCLNLQTQQCCKPRLNQHNDRRVSLVLVHPIHLRSGNVPTTPFRSSLASQSISPPHRLVTTHSGLFDQAWGTSIDVETLNQTLPQNLFAISLFPYIGFLYHLTKSKKAPPMTLFGFYFLLVFVFATIPAGIYAKKVYETSLANVDYLHGSAEFLLTLTNLFIVMGLRKAIREAESENAAKAAAEGSKTTSE